MRLGKPIAEIALASLLLVSCAGPARLEATRRRVGSQRGSLPQEIRRHLVSGMIEHSETARPPIAPLVDIGARVEEQTDHLAVVEKHRVNQRRRAKTVFVIG